MATVANFPDLASAQVASTMLAAEGIESTIPDEHVAGLDWRMTAALHGIRLQVADEDAQRAKELLAETFAPDASDVDGVPIEGEDVCPRCQSAAIAPSRWRYRLKALTILIPTLLLAWPFLSRIREQMRCSTCGARWAEPRSN